MQKYTNVGLYTVNSVSVKQTLLCVNLFPEQDAVGVLGQAAVQLCDCLCWDPAASVAWRVG